jgi:hypothetical protein
MTEQISQLVQQYWPIIAGIILFLTKPDMFYALLAKAGIGKPVNVEPDPLEIVLELAKINRDQGLGAGTEINALYQKLSEDKPQ